MKLALLPFLALSPAAHAQQASVPVDPAADQQVVVTAIRAGAPVWRVRSGASTLVMVGAIDNVAAGTEWRPQALAETVGHVDWVMFPQMVAININPFAMIGYLAKWKRRAKLPAGQSLSAMLGPADSARLARLAAQGLAPADYDRWHPLHLAFNMGDRLRKKTGMMEAAQTTVSRAASKHKVQRVPIQRTSARPLVDDVFKSTPAEHLPCLSATISAVEAGPEGLRARSRHWAGRRIAATLASPSQRLSGSCWPSNLNPVGASDLDSVTRRVLATSGTTLAVLNLDTLAQRGGLLDRLQSTGFQVEGPAWR